MTSTSTAPRAVLSVATRDGWQLELEHLPAVGPARCALLCGPAMMADRRSLDRPRGKGLGSYFQRCGYEVYLLDPRGHGGSGPAASRSVDWSYDDIVRRDLPAAVRAVRARAPELPLVCLGHSLCGHGFAAAVGLFADLPVDLLAMLSANIWLQKLEPSRPHWWTKRALLASWAGVTGLRGFFPARALHLGTADEPRSYVAQFETWAATGRWLDASGRTDYLETLARVTIPVLSVAARGDRLFCRTICARAFAAQLRRAPVTFWEVGARELGTRHEPGHMDVVTDPESAPLWQRIDAWIRPRLPL